MAAIGVIRAAHAGCISDMGHSGVSKIQRRMSQMGWFPFLMWMCGLGWIVHPGKEGDPALPFLKKFPWLFSVFHFL